MPALKIVLLPLLSTTLPLNNTHPSPLVREMMEDATPHVPAVVVKCNDEGTSSHIISSPGSEHCQVTILPYVVSPRQVT